MMVLSGRVSPGIGLEETGMSSEIGMSDAQPGEKRLILLVEDNLTNQEVVNYQLEVLGYECEIADDGVQGLELWKSGCFDLMLTDCHMPKMDGYEMTVAIRALEKEQNLKASPIIALTANALQGEAERCHGVGMDDYLSKPVELKNLKNMLKKWTGTK